MRSAMRQSQREVTSATVGSRYRPRNDMAVLNTPERSLSDLLSTSRAADATTGCGPSPRCGVVIIRCKVSSKRSEEHTSELQSLMRISYAVFCLKKKKQNHTTEYDTDQTEHDRENSSTTRLYKNDTHKKER